MELFDNLKTKNIWIYGIGVIGKRICQVFNGIGVTVTGILVSNKRGNIERYMGIPVFEIDEYLPKKDDLVIVSADGRAKKDIVNNLISRNINHMVWNLAALSEFWKKHPYRFENRNRNKEKMCLVLCGYKDYLWDEVFKRLNLFVPEDIDVCLCSAGKYDDRLSQIAEKNDWSYLSTELNSVSLIQNICISLFEDAKWIYKMDEDMFVTNNSFNSLMNTAQEIDNSGKYEVGIVSSLIPVNAIGYRIVLEKYGLLNDYENKFGRALIGGQPQREIEKNPETAKYMWGCKDLPMLDILASDMCAESGYYICATRLSIGFILFQKELWRRMQGFLVQGSMDLGVDEEDLNGFCINESKITAISLQSVVGHFGFGKQTEEMRKYYMIRKDRFELEKNNNG